MNMQKLGASGKPGALASKKSDGQEVPEALPDQDEVGKRGPLHQISGWMVSLRAVCATVWGRRVLVCVQVLESAQVL